ncbi:MAG: PKD domain-containing protein, partial [Candidatus Nealsonbacteria bacterium]|nr:PKD domain-containing protein [Candidatus Nealsonbacteria bacterium]
ISYNASFEWRVRARDSFGHWSEWTATRTFSTALHAHPWIDFTWSPTSPSVNEVVQFTDGSIVYSTPPTKTSFFWTFPDGSPATSSVQNATTTFTSAGSKNVSLRVRDFSNFECTGLRSVSITLPLPEWREIIPF